MSTRSSGRIASRNAATTKISEEQRELRTNLDRKRTSSETSDDQVTKRKKKKETDFGDESKIDINIVKQDATSNKSRATRSGIYSSVNKEEDQQKEEIGRSITDSNSTSSKMCLESTSTAEKICITPKSTTGITTRSKNLYSKPEIKTSNSAGAQSSLKKQKLEKLQTAYAKQTSNIDADVKIRSGPVAISITNPRREIIYEDDLSTSNDSAIKSCQNTPQDACNLQNNSDGSAEKMHVEEALDVHKNPPIEVDVNKDTTNKSCITAAGIVSDNKVANLSPMSVVHQSSEMGGLNDCKIFPDNKSIEDDKSTSTETQKPNPSVKPTEASSNALESASLTLSSNSNKLNNNKSNGAEAGKDIFTGSGSEISNLTSPRSNTLQPSLNKEHPGNVQCTTSSVSKSTGDSRTVASSGKSFVNLNKPSSSSKVLECIKTGRKPIIAHVTCASKISALANAKKDTPVKDLPVTKSKNETTKVNTPWTNTTGVQVGKILMTPNLHPVDKTEALTTKRISAKQAIINKCGIVKIHTCRPEALAGTNSGSNTPVKLNLPKSSAAKLCFIKKDPSVLNVNKESASILNLSTSAAATKSLLLFKNATAISKSSVVTSTTKVTQSVINLQSTASVAVSKSQPSTSSQPSPTKSIPTTSPISLIKANILKSQSAMNKTITTSQSNVIRPLMDSQKNIPKTLRKIPTVKTLLDMSESGKSQRTQTQEQQMQQQQFQQPATSLVAQNTLPSTSQVSFLDSFPISEQISTNIWEDNNTPNSLKSFDMYNLSEEDEDLAFEGLLEGQDKSNSHSAATDVCPIESLVPSITSTLTLVPALGLSAATVNRLNSNYVIQQDASQIIQTRDSGMISPSGSTAGLNPAVVSSGAGQGVTFEIQVNSDSERQFADQQLSRLIRIALTPGGGLLQKGFFTQNPTATISHQADKLSHPPTVAALPQNQVLIPRLNFSGQQVILHGNRNYTSAAAGLISQSPEALQKHYLIQNPSLVAEQSPSKPLWIREACSEEDQKKITSDLTKSNTLKSSTEPTTPFQNNANSNLQEFFIKTSSDGAIDHQTQPVSDPKHCRSPILCSSSMFSRSSSDFTSNNSSFSPYNLSPASSTSVTPVPGSMPSLHLTTEHTGIISGACGSGKGKNNKGKCSSSDKITEGKQPIKDSSEMARVMDILNQYKEQLAVTSDSDNSPLLPCKRRRSKPNTTSETLITTTPTPLASKGKQQPKPLTSTCGSLTAAQQQNFNSRISLQQLSHSPLQQNIFPQANYIQQQMQQVLMQQNKNGGFQATIFDQNTEQKSLMAENSNQNCMSLCSNGASSSATADTEILNSLTAYSSTASDQPVTVGNLINEKLPTLPQSYSQSENKFNSNNALPDVKSLNLSEVSSNSLHCFAEKVTSASVFNSGSQSAERSEKIKSNLVAYNKSFDKGIPDCRCRSLDDVDKKLVDSNSDGFICAQSIPELYSILQHGLGFAEEGKLRLESVQIKDVDQMSQIVTEPSEYSDDNLKVFRRANQSEKALALVYKRCQQGCKSSNILVALVLWEAIKKDTVKDVADSFCLDPSILQIVGEEEKDTSPVSQKCLRNKSELKESEPFDENPLFHLDLLSPESTQHTAAEVGSESEKSLKTKIEVRLTEISEIISQKFRNFLLNDQVLNKTDTSVNSLSEYRDRQLKPHWSGVIATRGRFKCSSQENSSGDNKYNAFLSFLSNSNIKDERPKVQEDAQEQIFLFPGLAQVIKEDKKYNADNLVTTDDPQKSETIKLSSVDETGLALQQLNNKNQSHTPTKPVAQSSECKIDNTDKSADLSFSDNLESNKSVKSDRQRLNSLPIKKRPACGTGAKLSAKTNSDKLMDNIACTISRTSTTGASTFTNADSFNSLVSNSTDNTQEGSDQAHKTSFITLSSVGTHIHTSFTSSSAVASFGNNAEVENLDKEPKEEIIAQPNESFLQLLNDTEKVDDNSFSKYFSSATKHNEIENEEKLIRGVAVALDNQSVMLIHSKNDVMSLDSQNSNSNSTSINLFFTNKNIRNTNEQLKSVINNSHAENLGVLVDGLNNNEVELKDTATIVSESYAELKTKLNGIENFDNNSNGVIEICSENNNIRDELMKKIHFSDEIIRSMRVNTPTTNTVVTKWIKPKLAVTGPYQSW